MIHNGYRISEASRILGVSTKTIIRWEKFRKIRPFRRDYKGWRIISLEDLEEMKKFMNKSKVYNI